MFVNSSQMDGKYAELVKFAFEFSGTFHVWRIHSNIYDFHKKNSKKILQPVLGKGCPKKG
jgi:hypothetical protein